MRLTDLPRAEEALREEGWTRKGKLRLAGGRRGSAWVKGGRELDLLGLPGRWGEEAVSAAQRNVVDGRPTLTLPHLVVAKLISGRAVDVADLSRMLGAADAEALAAVRGAVTRHLPDALGDLEQLIVLGRLEYEPPPPDELFPGATRTSVASPARRHRFVPSSGLFSGSHSRGAPHAQPARGPSRREAR